MKKGFVFLIVFGSILFVAGSAAFGLAIAKGAFKNNSLTQEVTKEYILEDSYSKIDVDIVTADLTFKPSEDDKTKVVSVEKEKIHHTAKVSSDTLVIREEDDRKFYEKWFGFVSRMKITVYLPETTYSELKIEITTGDVLVEDAFTFDNQKIKSTTGDIKLSNIKGTTADIDITTGGITLNNYKLTGALDAETTTGDFKFDDVECSKATLHTTSGDYTLNSLIVTGSFDEDRPNLDVSGTSSEIIFKNCDARNIKMKTITGDIKGNFLTEKNITVEQTTGKAKVDSSSLAADKCFVKTTTGDIDIVTHAI